MNEANVRLKREPATSPAHQPGHNEARQQGSNLADQVDAAVAILNGAVSHAHGQEVTGAIHQDVALAAVDLLGRIVAARPGRGHDFDRLTVHDPERRAGITSLMLTRGHEQDMVQPLQPAVVGQAAEPVMNGAARWSPVGQRAPRAAGA